jgi:hypothetical protein
MIRFYILPVIWTGEKQRAPKYLKSRYNPDGLPCRWSAKYYGLVDACLVACELTQDQHEQLAVEPDVAAAPEDIDQTISPVALPQAVAVLEALRIPAQWVTTSHTYRELLRMVAHLFMFAQRYHGMWHEGLIDSPAQLDLRWNEIPKERQDRITATADNQGYTYADVKPTWLVRRILKYLGDQWGDRPVLFGFTQL